MLKLEDDDVDNLKFERHGATTNVTNNLLKETFHEREPLVHAEKPETTGAFEENIRSIIADIRP